LRRPPFQRQHFEYDPTVVPGEEGVKHGFITRFEKFLLRSRRQIEGGNPGRRFEASVAVVLLK
jgi:hypothetical protein